MPTTQKRTTGWVVLETLANYGINTVFGIPGTHNLEFYRPLETLGIRPVTTRHEQGAGYGADAWSLQTGLPGVVITTSGPGLLNALSAAGTAFAESRPMIILSPGVALGAEFSDSGTLHETKDQLSAAAAIVEWGRRVKTAEEAVAAVHDAFELFATGRPRPVYIEVPLNILEQETSISASELAAKQFEPVPSPDKKLIAEAAALLSDAVNPVILAGGGARRAGQEIQALAEKLAAPVVTTLNGKGVIDEHHPLALGSNLRLAAAREVAQKADVLLVVGSKLGEAELWVDALRAQGKVVRIDVLESQLNKNQPATVGIRADAAAAVAAITELLDDADRTSAIDVPATLTAIRQESEKLDALNTSVGQAIARALPEDAILTTDSSKIAYWGLLNMLQVRNPRSVAYMATYATLGYGLPAAIGSKLASPERPVVAVTGDGAFMFSFNEMLTVVEQNLDIVILVVDNGGFAEIKDNEIAAGINPVAVDLVQPDWAALANACGGAGTRISSAEELDKAIEAAVAAGGLQLIHLPLA
ncbi:thiamine pyrophosphate-binding protein [Canibacter zhoujuaniae]|uniref:thiamine pyrophosphate-binding protein n=1 Tax=Canibacter zhoujuaniae TaxID=2708343 RepID=UPI0014205922|nr:thiamine pyrophosphate-binding protein [Canibacter zhoujuaniae]